ncbi:MAG: SDR family NAD(P)-dependent oxidoreductase [Chloroflexota bacterium]
MTAIASDPLHDPAPRRVAVVAGGAGGMGRVIAAQLADSGCTVAALDVRDTDSASHLRTARPIRFYSVDITRRAAVEDCLSQIESNLGPVAVLVNAAAVLTRRPFLELTDEDWESVLAINLRGTFLTCQLVARRMIRTGVGGRIVNISSNSQVMATPLAAHYAASKGGIAALTRTMALELAPHGITANLVCPGPVLTDMNRQVFADSNYRAERERTIPVGRLGQPDDVAAAVVFLAAEANAFITGSALFVDGGQTLTTAI